MDDAWHQQCNMLNYLDKIQLDLRDEQSVTKERVLFVLCRFVCEARK